MKAFLVLTSIVCFGYSAISSASIHTLIETELQQHEQHAIAAVFLSMPLRALSEYEI